MKNRLLDAIGNIDDKYIIEAHTENSKGIHLEFSIKQFGKIALAGVCLLMVMAIMPRMLSPYKSNDMAESAFSPDYNSGFRIDDSEGMPTNGSALKDEADVKVEKLIVTGSMELETLDFDSTLEAVTTSVDEMGGYIQSSFVNNNGSRYYESTIRIPADKYNEFIELIKESGNCTYYSESVEDITSKYYDILARLDSLKAEEERVLEFYNLADNISELMEIEERLTDIRSEIDSLEASMKNMNLLTSYSTLNLNIHERKVYTEVNESFWNKAVNSFDRGLNRFVMNIQNLILDIIYNMWTFVTIVVVGLTGFVVYRKIKNRKK